MSLFEFEYYDMGSWYSLFIILFYIMSEALVFLEFQVFSLLVVVEFILQVA